MAERLSELFDEFARGFGAGERPDVGEYLERAGEEADELAALLDAFLQAAPPPEPAEETVAMMEAWAAGEPPLLALRTQRGLKRAEVIGALMKLLGLEPARGRKVAGYYHRLETGLLDPSRVDRRVFEALAETLNTRVTDLLTWRPSPLEAQPAMYRVALDAVTTEMAAPAATPPQPTEEHDEIDRLFRGEPK